MCENYPYVDEHEFNCAHISKNKEEYMAVHNKNFRDTLVEMVKAAGQEVIDRAEDLVGNGDLITDFDIWLRFPMDGRIMTGCPTIEVTRSHVSKKSCDVLFERVKHDV